MEALPIIQRAIQLDRTGKYKEAWNLVTFIWRNDELRNSDKVGDEETSNKFIKAVQLLHRFFLDKQGEIS